MATYFGVEQSTDSRDPRTRVERLGSGKRGLERAIEYAKKSSHLTYADPHAARNFHHTLYSAWEVELVRELPTPARCATQAAERSTRDYPTRAVDVFADRIECLGRRVLRCGCVESCECKPAERAGEIGGAR